MLPWRQTTTISENRASQQIDQGLLTFAIIVKLLELILLTSVWSELSWSRTKNSKFESIIEYSQGPALDTYDGVHPNLRCANAISKS